MKGLEGVFDLVDDLIVNGQNFKNISGEIDLPAQDKIKTQYDVTMKLGLDNLHPFDHKYMKSNRIKIEPGIDIYEEKAGYQIIVLTSNIEEKDIKIYSKDNRLIFEAKNAEIAYYKEITVPCMIDDQKLSWIYKNGVTEITIRK
jgi:HSP20 family molecular chaperone IbpA